LYGRNIDIVAIQIKEDALSWTPDIAAAGGPIYMAIADALARDARSGALPAGERLPPQRELAARLGVDLTTITRAYAEAARRGLIASEGRRGSFVRGAPAPADDPQQEAASGMNMPPEPEGGMLRSAIASGLAALLERNGTALHYQPSGGGEAERNAGAAWLSQLVPGTSPDQIVLAAGAQNALHAVAAALLTRGGRVAAGCFTYPGFLAIARRMGAEIVPLAMDEEGILPDAFDDSAALNALQALYVVPTNDNPTTATMGKARREAIAAIARRHSVPIIEDDAYGRLPERPPFPLASWAPELSWHIASVSKIVSPSLRIAFVRAPSVRDAAALAADVHETAVMPPPLNAALVASWLADGTFPRLVAAVRAEAGARMKEALAVLPGARGDPDGYHLWLPLEGGLSASAVAARAVAAGLPAVPGSAFSSSGETPIEALRISLGGSRSRSAVTRELRRLDALIAQSGRPAYV
jgi:DNA-binding transcriptional MocR family regulator